MVPVEETSGSGVRGYLRFLLGWLSGVSAGSDLKMLVSVEDWLPSEMDSGMRCRAIWLSYAGNFWAMVSVDGTIFNRGVMDRGAGIWQAKMRIRQGGEPENTRFRSLFITLLFTLCPPLDSVQAGDGGGTIVCRCVDGRRCRGVCSCIGGC